MLDDTTLEEAADAFYRASGWDGYGHLAEIERLAVRQAFSEALDVALPSLRREAAEQIAVAIEQRRSSTAHRIPWEAFTDAANTARRLFAEPKPKRARREPCDVHCPCICHDGYGGAHPNEDCRVASGAAGERQEH